MLIKLDRLDFNLGKVEESTISQSKRILSKADWVRIDRIVMAIMFLTVIAGSLIFR